MKKNLLKLKSIKIHNSNDVNNSVKKKEITEWSKNSNDSIGIIYVYNGNIDLSSLKLSEGLNLPGIVNGGLYLNSLTSAEGLKLPETVNGNLNLESITLTSHFLP